MTGNGVSAGPAPGLKNEKNRIREEMLKARLSVPEDVKCGADVIMTKKLLSLASFRYAGTILFYYPIKGEPDITGAVSAALADGQRPARELLKGRKTDAPKKEDEEGGAFGTACVMRVKK